MMNHKMSLAVREGNRCKLTIKIFSECSHNSHRLVTVVMKGRLVILQLKTDYKLISLAVCPRQCSTAW